MLVLGTIYWSNENVTVIPTKWRLTDAVDGSPIKPSLRGGWGHDIQARVFLARGCTLSYALAASSASAAATASSSSAGSAHREDSTVVCCARREA